MLRLAIYMAMVIAISVMSSGCVTMKTVEQERVDQQLTGNQGFLVGGPRYEEQQKDRPKTKKYFKIEVDMSRWQRPRVEEPDIDTQPVEATESAEAVELTDYPEPQESTRAQMAPGEYNRGIITPAEEIEMGPPVTEEKIGYDIVEKEPMKVEPPKPSFTHYTVKKNETLWDIAGREEVYGDPTKWRVIYEANQNQIKKPNLIRPGMKLKIPR